MVQNGSFHHRDTDNILKGEIRSGQILEETPELVLCTMFPIDELPASPDAIYEHLKEEMMVFEGRTCAFIVLPLIGKKQGDKTDEVIYAEFFNSFMEKAKGCFKKPIEFERTFTGLFSSLPLLNYFDNIQCKPDILLIRKGTLLSDKERDGDCLP